MNLKGQHLQDLKSSGLSDEMIELSACYSIDRAKGKHELTYDPGSDGLAIPYPGTNGNGPAFVRIKPDVPFKDSEGRPAKYLTAKNAGNRLYIPPIYSDRHFRDLHIPVIIT